MMKDVLDSGGSGVDSLPNFLAPNTRSETVQAMETAMGCGNDSW